MVAPNSNNKLNATVAGTAAAVGVILTGLVLLNQSISLPAGTLPDSTKTLGATRQVTSQEVCVRGSSGSARDVPESEKQAVYREYGIMSHKPGEYEIDHLISLELGGSNDIHNLWPQSYETKPWNAHEKDKLEDRLHEEVCKGVITLEEAQKEISTDWTKAYKDRFGDPK